MPTLNVDGLTFTFPQTWQVSKYDEWSFYRSSFARQGEGIKAIDVLAITETNVAFFIGIRIRRSPLTCLKQSQARYCTLWLPCFRQSFVPMSIRNGNWRQLSWRVTRSA
ncbi:hypothetical protein [Caballeronia sp. LZ043]|uniref:hypothetical protein n=1 Tax=Caballeronia sp. LZ043 TaxID=3038569 RepID=UPI002860908F|nr:hypothetical protein [Caballeronia sp. LZ043]MDR5825359.1 hypothetical protein [Caballeronia sp. LZ043]